MRRAFVIWSLLMFVLRAGECLTQLVIFITKIRGDKRLVKMPRGRSKKISPIVSSAPNPTPVVNISSEGGGSASAPDRPLRNRIAVRKFGDLPSACSSTASSTSQPHPDLSGTSVRAQGGGDGYVLIHKSFWSDMCSKLACSSCGKTCVQMKTEKLSGLTYKLVMFCTSCGVVLSQVTSGPDGGCESEYEDEVDYDVNWRFVKFFVEEGKTYDDVVTFSKTLGIPVMSQKMFKKYEDKILSGDT